MIAQTPAQAPAKPHWTLRAVQGVVLGTLLALAILNLLAAGSGARLFYYQGF